MITVQQKQLQILEQDVSHSCDLFIDSFIFIVVPDPQVTLTLDKPLYNVGDTAIFTCTAEINSSIAINIDENIMVAMEVNGTRLNMPIREQNFLRYFSTHAVAITDTTVATQYACTVMITSTSRYIMANYSNVVTCVCIALSIL